MKFHSKAWMAVRMLAAAVLMGASMSLKAQDAVDQAPAATESAQKEADKLVEDFLKAPAVKGPQLIPRWGEATETAASEKMLAAHRLVDAQNPAAFVRMWKLFPDLSDDEQGIFAFSIQGAVCLNQVPTILAMQSKAKSKTAAELMRLRANGILMAALDVPEKADEAGKLALQLKEKGAAGDHLLKKMEARAAARK